MNRQQAVNFLKILKYDFEQNALKAEKEIKKHRLMSNANMLQQIKISRGNLLKLTQTKE